MTPEDALVHLQGNGWRWYVHARHSTEHEPRFDIFGYSPWRRVGDEMDIVLYGLDDLDAAVAEALSTADRLAAEHAYNPYTVAA